MSRIFAGAARKLPIDLGQGEVRFRTMAKTIAMRCVLDDFRMAGSKRTALDVGCREGYQTRWLTNRDFQVTPIDIQPMFDGGITVDVNKGLPFPDQSFDLVWCSEVIEHLENPRSIILDFVRVTKPGGTIILTTPNSRAWFYRLGCFLGYPPERIQNPGHLHFFSMTDIESIFRSISEYASSNVYGYFPYSLVKQRTSSRMMTALLSPSFIIHIRKHSS